jgi:hypothetical protein
MRAVAQRSLHPTIDVSCYVYGPVFSQPHKKQDSAWKPAECSTLGMIAAV